MRSVLPTFGDFVIMFLIVCEVVQLVLALKFVHQSSRFAPLVFLWVWLHLSLSQFGISQPWKFGLVLLIFSTGILATLSNMRNVLSPLGLVVVKFLTIGENILCVLGIEISP